MNSLNDLQFTYEDIEAELDLYEKGRKLLRVTQSDAWEIIVETLKDYRDKTVQDLINLDPGDPSVPAAHAAASALDQLFYNFQQDVQKCVTVAAKPSQELSLYLSGALNALDVAKAMEDQQSR